ncbi:PA26 p53-induced protein-domain-containing protein [Radiomyces spectabilis]|uniref:PA26 p53-induced protein-domain-containing protein n=1 Tax=Radiomyces spectabilis TaxID=64574 RepID=UPI002220FCB1|nr:PA26 p53-induced protein-domain-containing protein [Radiomyces spectabilis]KAI8369494.1 PA26 p53-induced protein-domain-containing protein [Radiomyces spectabilis]
MHQEQSHDGHFPMHEEIARDTRARQLQASRLRIALFKGLQVDSSAERQATLEQIVQVVKSYMRVAKSPFSPSKCTQPSTWSPATPTASSTDTTTHTHHAVTTTATQSSPTRGDAASFGDPLASYEEAGGTDEQLQYFLLTILRLSLTCPFSDVRRVFKDFLQITTDTAIPTPQPRHRSPSYFISLNDVFSLESTSSSKRVTYPCPANLSFSPWSQEAESTDSLDSVSDVMRSAWRSTSTLAGDEVSIHSVASDVDDCNTGGRPSDEYVRQMMIRTFMEEGRVNNLFRVMSFFPTFYEIFHSTFTKTIRASIGPLQRTWRSYLGILAAAEHSCQYLVSILKLDFLQSGGDPLWLKGIHYCPAKLQSISGVILKLARQPWRLDETDIRRIMNNTRSSLGDAWSKGELVQAIVVVSTILGLSSFVLGCGIAPEVDMRGGYYIRGYCTEDLEGIEHELDQRSVPSPYDIEVTHAASNATGWHDSTIESESHESSSTAKHEDDRFSSDIGRGLGVSVDSDDGGDDLDSDAADIMEHTNELISKLQSNRRHELQESLEKLNLHCLREEQQQRKQDALESSNGTSLADRHRERGSDWMGSVNAVYEDLDRFVDPQISQCIQLEEFQSGQGGCHEFMLGEYCWEDHGCDLMNQFLPGVGDEVDDEFNEALSITDWSIFHQVSEGAVDTTPLRHAIWFYAQQLFGVTKEDYMYSDIPTYLSQRNKDYIQRVCRRPHEIRWSDWNNIGISLRPEEKCHINLLVASAKKQALLCYGLSLISQV